MIFGYGSHHVSATAPEHKGNCVKTFFVHQYQPMFVCWKNLCYAFVSLFESSLNKIVVNCFINGLINNFLRHKNAQSNISKKIPPTMQNPISILLNNLPSHIANANEK